MLPDKSADAYIIQFDKWLEWSSAEGLTGHPAFWFRDWIVDLHEAGFSTSGMTKAMAVIKAVLLYRLEWSRSPEWQDVQQTIQRLSFKHRPARRMAFSLGQLHRIMMYPPRYVRSGQLRVDRGLWEDMLAVSFTFLLRKQEIRWVRPTDLVELPDGSWRVRVVKPKIGDDPQEAGIPRHLIPASLLPYLRRYRLRQDLQHFDGWKCWGDLAKHFRYVLGDVVDGVVVFHCIRHGRAMQLYRSPGVDAYKLMTYGRWRRLASVLVYIHH